MILVTGYKGFIGKNLFDKLIQLNYSITGLDDEYFLEEDWQGWLKKYLNDKSPSFVFHVGACSDTLEIDVNYMLTRNYESTRIISSWCERNGAGLVYSSSAANYGTSGRTPTNLYGWSKKIAEDFVLLSGQIALRYFNVFGPGEEGKGRMASVAYQSWIKNKRKESIKLFPGNPTRDFIYVRDVVDANIVAMKNYKSSFGSYYDVGMGVSSPFEDILENLGIPYTYTDSQEIPIGYQFFTKADKSKFIRGWEPRWTLTSALSDYKKYLE
jgi:ADP-L-glycero-D-manno-heptose 6-epimerase